VDDVRRFPARLFSFSPEVEREQQEIRDFLFQNVYLSAELKPEKEQAEQVISELFEFFLRFPDELPSGYQEKLSREPVYRVVCDYLAGMTDNYILEQYHRFCSPAKGATV
jgi:dGTPase